MKGLRPYVSKIFLASFLLFAGGWLFLVRSDIELFFESVFAGPPLMPKTRLVRIGSVPVIVDMAVADDEKRKGLSGREKMPQSRGMLFMFQKPGYYAFWMKGMRFPIDIIWISNDLRVVGVTENLPAPRNISSKPATVFPPEPIKYALEVNAGWAGKHYIEKGDLLVFTE